MALQSTLVLLPTLKLAMDAVDPEAWPLIGFLMEDAVYRQHFVEMVALVSSEVFTPQRMMPIYEQNFAMLWTWAKPLTNYVDLGGVACLRFRS